MLKKKPKQQKASPQKVQTSTKFIDLLITGKAYRRALPAPMTSSILTKETSISLANSLTASLGSS